MKYKVEHNFIYGWDDADWHEGDDETPWRFDSIEEAEAEIDDFIKSTEEAVESGHMDEPYDREDYRVVPVTDTVQD